MRLTEALSFFEENPTNEEISFRFSHLDIRALKLEMATNKEFGKAVKSHRKMMKEKKNQEDDIFDGMF